MTPVNLSPEAKREKNRLAQAAWRAANKERALATKRAWREENRERINEAERRRLAENAESHAKRRASILKHLRKPDVQKSRVEYYKAWLLKNPDKLREYNARNKSNNPGTHAACCKRRIIRKRNAVPPWADQKAINAIYKEAKRLTIETGIEHHVDHIVPLSGRNVCGLHVASNLRAIPAAVNMQKHNSFIEELVS